MNEQTFEKRESRIWCRGEFSQAVSIMCVCVCLYLFLCAWLCLDSSVQYKRLQQCCDWLLQGTFIHLFYREKERTRVIETGRQTQRERKREKEVRELMERFRNQEVKDGERGSQLLLSMMSATLLFSLLTFCTILQKHTQTYRVYTRFLTMFKRILWFMRCLVEMCKISCTSLWLWRLLSLRWSNSNFLYNPFLSSSTYERRPAIAFLLFLWVRTEH